MSFAAAILFGALPALSASAQDGRTQDVQKSKASADKSAGTDAGRFCANVAPSITEARIAWQTKRLTEIDEEVKQRLDELEKTEASLKEWIAKREAMLKTANDDLVAIYAKMQPETAAVQISAMDDPMAAAILSKLKPGAAGAILNEMEAERASKIASFISGASGAEKKS
jgi:flagellar motility protein MotE (MotC chaperone)